jgi:hypothetical protein
MLHKALSLLIVSAWLLGMGVLFTRDILPAWTAQDLPLLVNEKVVAQIGGQLQAGIFAASGRRIGTSWTEIVVLHDVRRIDSTHHLEDLGELGHVLVTSSLRFDDQDRLAEFGLDFAGAPVKIGVEGETVGNEIVCKVRVGDTYHAFHVNADIAGRFSESLRPFSALPGLAVGQKWRIYMVDPMSLLVGGKASPRPAVAHVTGREPVPQQPDAGEAFVVECNGSRTWVDERGKVLRSELALPLVGRLIIRDEPFDEQALLAARQLLADRALPAPPPSPPDEGI